MQAYSKNTRLFHEKLSNRSFFEKTNFDHICNLANSLYTLDYVYDLDDTDNEVARGIKSRLAELGVRSITTAYADIMIDNEKDEAVLIFGGSGIGKTSLQIATLKNYPEAWSAGCSDGVIVLNTSTHLFAGIDVPNKCNSTLSRGRKIVTLASSVFGTVNVEANEKIYPVKRVVCLFKADDTSDSMRIEHVDKAPEILRNSFSNRLGMQIDSLQLVYDLVTLSDRANERDFETLSEQLFCSKSTARDNRKHNDITIAL